MNDAAEGGPARPLSDHILPASGTMIGICVTLIGLVKVVEQQTGPSRVDEYAGLTALLFLVSAGCSYFALRGDPAGRYARRAEVWADTCFMVGLFGLVFVALLFAYEII